MSNPSELARLEEREAAWRTRWRAHPSFDATVLLAATDLRRCPWCQDTGQIQYGVDVFLCACAAGGERV